MNITTLNTARAAELARELRGDVFELSDREFQLLHRACAGHTHERYHPDVTVQTCWDADRLDLGRVGITPSPAYLNTEVAKRPETINWADRRQSAASSPRSSLANGRSNSKSGNRRLDQLRSLYRLAAGQAKARD